MRCIACHIGAMVEEADNAFLAGIAFVVSHNDACVQRSLCSMHKERLVRAGTAAATKIKPENRR